MQILREIAAAGPLVLHRSESPRPDIGSVACVGLTRAFMLVLAPESSASIRTLIQHALIGMPRSAGRPWGWAIQRRPAQARRLLR